MTSPSTSRFLLALAGVAIVCGTGAIVHGDDGRSLFKAKCASCHGTDGRAHTPAGRKLGARDLKLSTLSDNQIALVIREGRLDPSQKSKMPGFKEKLTPRQIELLVAYVKGFRG